jgi:hypothetical protein
VGFGEVEHRLRRISGHHPEPAVNQVGGEQPTPAANLDDQPIALSHRLKKPEDSWRTGIGVEPETQMMDEGQVLSVIGHPSPWARFHVGKYRGPDRSEMPDPSNHLMTQSQRSGAVL